MRRWRWAPMAISMATYYGGTFGDGTIFKVTTNGALTSLFSFDGTNGLHPLASLTRGTDGNFYGTTTEGGTYGDGSIFSMTTNGILTRLFSFKAPTALILAPR